MNRNRPGVYARTLPGFRPGKKTGKPGNNHADCVSVFPCRGLLRLGTAENPPGPLRFSEVPPVKKLFALLAVVSLAAIGCDDKKSTPKPTNATTGGTYEKKDTVR